jgi:hypothetical protein
MKQRGAVEVDVPSKGKLKILLRVRNTRRILEATENIRTDVVVG